MLAVSLSSTKKVLSPVEHRVENTRSAHEAQAQIIIPNMLRVSDVTSHDTIWGAQPSEDPVNWCEAEALSWNVATQLGKNDHESTLYNRSSTIS